MNIRTNDKVLLPEAFKVRSVPLLTGAMELVFRAALTPKVVP